MVTLRTVEQIKSRYTNAKTVMGLSNISFGLPERKFINRNFLLMAVYAGLDAWSMDSSGSFGSDTVGAMQDFSLDILSNFFAIPHFFDDKLYELRCTCRKIIE